MVHVSGLKMVVLKVGLMVDKWVVILAEKLVSKRVDLWVA